jgi:aryl-alcohol dehydrogenase-like predicted oxidoreductase
MRYNRLGSTGLVVSELCLGAMTFGTSAKYSAVNGLDQQQSTALVKQAFDGGINFIDTANSYTAGESEQITGRALKDLGIARDELIIATKGRSRIREGRNNAGTHRYHLLNQVDESLGRLGLDHVDLYQIHGWDPETPMEEGLRALEDIVRSGRARYIGVSNWAAWQIAKALGIAERRGFDKFASVQAYYTLVGRELEREIIPMLNSEGLGLLVWSPLAGGVLSGKYQRSGDGLTGEGRRMKLDFPRIDLDLTDALIAAMRPMAERQGASVAAVALAWLLYKPAVSSVIIGVKNADQLADNISACGVELTADEMAELDRLSVPAPEYPGWILDRQDLDPRASPRRVAK